MKRVHRDDGARAKRIDSEVTVTDQDDNSEGPFSEHRRPDYPFCLPCGGGWSRLTMQRDWCKTAARCSPTQRLSDRPGAR